MSRLLITPNNVLICFLSDSVLLISTPNPIPLSQADLTSAQSASSSPSQAVVLHIYVLKSWEIWYCSVFINPDVVAAFSHSECRTHIQPHSSQTYLNQTVHYLCMHFKTLKDLDLLIILVMVLHPFLVFIVTVYNFILLLEFLMKFSNDFL